MEKLDKKRYLKRVIIVCWLALIICSCIKLFGGNLFEIVCENENFIKVCEYADNHLWADILISGSVCFVQLYFLILAMCQKIRYNKTELIIFSATVITGTILKILAPSWLGVVFDFWQVIFMPSVFLWKDKKRWINIVIANFLLVAFQMLSLITKNLSLSVLGDSILEGAIYSIDVMIMIVLYYCYSNLIIRKEG